MAVPVRRPTPRVNGGLRFSVWVARRLSTAHSRPRFRGANSSGNPAARSPTWGGDEPRDCSDPPRALLAAPENLPRPLEIGGRVDAERRAVDDAGVDAHACFERAQLLEFFASFERRRRQRDEPGERDAAKRVKTDVVIERALARGCHGAGEIERA